MLSHILSGMALDETVALLPLEAGAKAKAEPAILATSVAERVAFMVACDTRDARNKRSWLCSRTTVVGKDLLQSTRMSHLSAVLNQFCIGVVFGASCCARLCRLFFDDQSFCFTTGSNKLGFKYTIRIGYVTLVARLACSGLCLPTARFHFPHIEYDSLGKLKWKSMPVN
jgi:hypothetical protein